jgi:hypothetical protein
MAPCPCPTYTGMSMSSLTTHEGVVKSNTPASEFKDLVGTFVKEGGPYKSGQGAALGRW